MITLALAENNGSIDLDPRVNMTQTKCMNFYNTFLMHFYLSPFAFSSAAIKIGISICL